MLPRIGSDWFLQRLDQLLLLGQPAMHDAIGDLVDLSAAEQDVKC
jgi:hypothetical protein